MEDQQNSIQQVEQRLKDVESVLHELAKRYVKSVSPQNTSNLYGSVEDIYAAVGVTPPKR